MGKYELTPPFANYCDTFWESLIVYNDHSSNTNLKFDQQLNNLHD
jgi:hypothetical protein